MQVVYPNGGPVNNILFANAVKELQNTRAPDIVTLGLTQLEITREVSILGYRFTLSGAPIPNNKYQLYHTARTVTDYDICNHPSPMSFAKHILVGLLEQYKNYVSKHFSSSHIPVPNSVNQAPFYAQQSVYHNPFRERHEMSLRGDPGVEIPDGEYITQDIYIHDKIGGKNARIKFVPKKDMTAYELFHCMELLKLTTVRGSKMAYITDHELNRHWEVLDNG